HQPGQGMVANEPAFREGVAVARRNHSPVPRHPKFCSIASRRNFGISPRSLLPYPLATAADSDASVPADSGMGTPLSAPVATADMMSFRNVRMSRVISGFSPFITPILLFIQPLAYGASCRTSNI